MQQIVLPQAPPHAGRQQHHQALWEALSARLADTAAAREAKSPHKWPVSRRLDALLDPDAPFLALSALAGGEDEQCPDGAGIVTGIGRVEQTTCMIIANDWQHKGGTYRPATLAKHLRAQEIAWSLRLPCVYLVDSGGIYLPEQAHLFAGERHFGRMFYNQAHMSAEGIAQIAVVLGMCTAGGAYVPAMADETILVEKQGTIFLAGPALVEAATGEKTDAESLGGARVHGDTSGLVDHVARDEADAFVLCRDIIAALGPTTAGRQGFAPSKASQTPEPPAVSPEHLLRVMPEDLREPFPMLDVIACLLDQSAWHPFKQRWGRALLCGTGYLDGQPVGIVANDGLLEQAAAEKGAQFVQLCNQRDIPLLFLQNTTGFAVGLQAESQGIAKAGAKLVQAVSCARVPKITLIVGASHGAGTYAMCGRGMKPDFVFAWPNSRVSVMGPQQAVDTLLGIRKRAAAKRNVSLPPEQEAQWAQTLSEAYTRQATASFATSNLWDDGLILPADTRRTLALAFAACRSKARSLTRMPVTRH